MYECIILIYYYCKVFPFVNDLLILIVFVLCKLLCNSNKNDIVNNENYKSKSKALQCKT